jgi:PAS domain S-box-containing protein
MSLPHDRPAVQARSSNGLWDYTQEHLGNDAFNRLGVAIAQLTLGGSLLTVNDQLCEVLDRPRKDLLEKNFREIFQSEDSWSVCDGGLTQLIAGEIHRYSTELCAKRRDGQVVCVKMFFSLVREDVTEIPRSLIAVATDITTLKRELQDAVSTRNELS